MFTLFKQAELCQCPGRYGQFVGGERFCNGQSEPEIQACKCFLGYRSGILNLAKDRVSDIGVPECPWNILLGAASSITTLPTASMGMVGEYRSKGPRAQ